MDVSVIFATYNREDVINDVLDRWRKVKDKTKYEFEIICSDDESSDKTVEYIEKAIDLPITLIRNKKGGAGRARNAALKIAKGKIIIFTGDDMFPDENFVNAHFENYLKFGDNIATLGRIEWHENLKLNHLMYHITNIGCEQFGFVGLPPYQMIDFRHFYTSNISVSREKLNSLEWYFDTSFDKYGFEDIELGYRLEKQGVKIYYDPDIVITHHHMYPSGEKFCVRQLNAGEELVVFNDLHRDLEDKCIIDIDNYKKSFDLYFNKMKIWNRVEGNIIEFVNFLGKKSALFIEKILYRKSFSFLRKTCSLVYAGIFKYSFYFGAAKKIANGSCTPSEVACFAFRYMKKGYTQIYYDTGHGFNEKESRKWVCWSDEFNSLEMNLPDKVRKIRITPMKNKCKAEIVKMEFVDTINKKVPAKVECHNACSDNSIKYDFTNTDDPQIIVKEIPKNYKKFIIDLKVCDMKKKNLFTAIKRVLGKFYHKQKVMLTSDKIEHISFEYGQPIRIQIGIEWEEKNQKDLVDIYRNAAKILGSSVLISPIEKMEEGYTDYIYKPLFEPLDRVQFIQVVYTLLNTPYDYVIVSKAFTEYPNVACKDERDVIIYSKLLGKTIETIDFNNAVGRYMRLPSFKVEKSIKNILNLRLPIELNQEYILSNSTCMPRFRISPREFGYYKDKPIIFVIPIFLAVGGVERNTIEVMRELKKEYSFCLLTMERHMEEQGSLHYQLQGICDYFFDMREITDHKNYLSVLYELKKIFNPDLLWVCNNSPWYEEHSSNIRKLFENIPIVMQDVYDTKVGWIEYYNCPGIKSCDRFIAVTELIKNTFITQYSIEEKKIDVIYSVVDAKKIREEKERPINYNEICKLYNLDINKQHYATVGRLTEQKDPIRYLKLIREVTKEKRMNNIQFIMVGDGVLREEVREYIEKNGMDDQVIQIPYISNTPQFMKFLDGLILTSLYEGMPIVSIEAMSMGTPVFTTETGDLKRFLKRTQGGIIVDEKKSDGQNFIEFYEDIMTYKSNAQQHEEEILNFFSVDFQTDMYRESFEKAISLYKKVKDEDSK